MGQPEAADKKLVLLPPVLEARLDADSHPMLAGRTPLPARPAANRDSPVLPGLL
jgi:hypothetical protein